MSGARHSGSITGLSSGGGLVDSLHKKKDKATEERAVMLKVFEKITEEAKFYHCLQVEFFSEYVKCDGHDAQLGTFGVLSHERNKDKVIGTATTISSIGTWLPQPTFYQ